MIERGLIASGAGLIVYAGAEAQAPTNLHAAVDTDCEGRLITPGFISDVLGIILLIPPTRAIVRAILTRGARTRVVMRVAGSMDGGRRSDGRPGRRTYDVDGTAVDVDDPTPRLQ